MSINLGKSVFQLIKKVYLGGGILLVSALLSGCQTIWENEVKPAPKPLPVVPVNSTTGTLHSAQGTKLSKDLKTRAQKIDAKSVPEPEVKDWQIVGSGQFIKPHEQEPVQSLQLSSKPEITLNFENTDIREVVKVILGDTLNLDYVLDPGVRGGVSMQTGAPLSKKDLLPTLETLLRMNNATLVEKNGMFHVLPVANAHKGLLSPQLAGSAKPIPTGYNLIVRPLQNISAEEMNDILEPLARDNSIVRVDTKRNLLLLAGTATDLQQMLEVIDTFDVDWLKGLSVGFFAIENAKVEDVQKDVEAVLGGDGGKAMGGLVRITPIVSANGLLVVTPQRKFLREVGKWIKRFDILPQGGDEQRLYVYRVRNGKAEDLASLLTQLLSGSSRNTPKNNDKKPSIAPGLTGTSAKSSNKTAQKNKAKLTGNTSSNRVAKTRTSSKSAKSAVSNRSSSSRSASTNTVTGDVNVVADEDHNTLLILATPHDYRKLMDILQQLDVVPLQVHIEATIVEVALRDSLKYGIQWFFDGKVNGTNSQGVGGLGGTNQGTDLSGGISKLLRGFNWSLIDSTSAVRAVFNAFADDSLINVLSAPSIMVLDNHEAMIQVGDEVPTLNSRQATDGGNPIESINYRETGIILNVKPRVNPGGLVTMEISQEVSAVADAEVQTNQPTIQTRKITSTVAVQSGQTVVLGGLIRDKQSGGDGGIPGLYQVPGLGALFGETKREKERAELVVVLTPRVITSAEDALGITRDFRVKMRGLKDEFLIEAGVIRDDAGKRVYGTTTKEVKEKTYYH